MLGMSTTVLREEQVRCQSVDSAISTALDTTIHESQDIITGTFKKQETYEEQAARGDNPVKLPPVTKRRMRISMKAIPLNRSPASRPSCPINAAQRL